MRLLGHFSPRRSVVLECFLDVSARAVVREPDHLRGLRLSEGVLPVDIPQGAGRDVPGVGVDDLLPVAGRIMCVPELQPGRGFVDGSLTGFVSGPMCREEDMEELLWWFLIRVEHAPGKGREICLWVDLLEF